MSYRTHLRDLMALGLPLAGSHVAQFSINLVDTVMLGWYDVRVLAAQVLAGTLFFVLFVVGSGFAWAVMPMVAEAQSRGDETRVRRVTRMGLWAVSAVALAMLPIFFFSRSLFLALGQEPELAELAQHYLLINGLSLLPALLVMVLKSYLSALTRVQIVLWVTVLAVGINALVNYALIFGNWGFPEMGIRGAAIASLLVSLFSATVLIIYILATLPEHALFQRLWRPDWEALSEVFRLGLPIGLTNLCEVSLFAASSLMMGWLGALTLAAHGIALNIASLTFMVHMGLSNAATVRAGHALGARDSLALRRGAWVAIAVSLFMAGLASVLFLSIPETLLRLFIGPDDPALPQVLAIGVGLLAAAAVFQTVDAAQVMALGLLRGIQDARVPMFMALVSYWGIGVPVSYGLGFTLGFGGVGIWIGLAMGLAAAAVLMTARFHRLSRRMPQGASA